MARVLAHRYHVVRLLGPGGMGEVYLGFDPVLERYVAIKQVAPSVLHHPENATLVAYFTREAKTVAALQHPSIIQVYEFGTPRDEAAYIFTEFIDGITLEELVETQGGLPVRAALALLHPLADALSYAHDRGIIHRDLKPGNVMISRHGRVFLMDFGLAKPIGGFPGTSGNLKSMIIGSPAFMAPEQIGGEETDRRTDVFAFGLLAFAVTTGRLFFSATAAHAFKEILADRYPIEVAAETVEDPDLRALVTGCIQRHPEDRFESMESIIALLERALSRAGVGSPAREMRLWSERWTHLMPQQFTLGPVHDPTASDTTPGKRPSADTELPGAKTIVASPDLTGIVAGPTLIEARPGAGQMSGPQSGPTPGPRSGPPSMIIEFERIDVEPPEPEGGRVSMQMPTVIEAAAHVRSPSIARTLEDTDGASLASPSMPATPADALRTVLLRSPDAGFLAEVLSVVLCSGNDVDLNALWQDLESAGVDAPSQRLGTALALLVSAEVLEHRSADRFHLGRQLLLDHAFSVLAPELGPGEAAPVWTEHAQRVFEHYVARWREEIQDARETYDHDRTLDVVERLLDVERHLRSVTTETRQRDGLIRAEAALARRDATLAFESFSELAAGPPVDLETDLRVRAGLAEACMLLAQGDGAWTARMLRVRGLLRLRRGELRRALVDLRIAVDHPAMKANPIDVARAQRDLGEGLWWAGRSADAQELCDMAAHQLEDAGDTAEAAAAVLLNALGRLRLGQVDSAEILLERARGSAKPVGARFVLAGTLVGLAEVERLRGRVDEAHGIARRALGEWEALRLPRGIAVARTELASILCDLGQIADATRHVDETLRSLDDDPLERLDAALIRAKVACRACEFGAAAAHVAEALRMAEGIGVPLPFAVLVRSRLCRESGDKDGADELRQEAVKLYESVSPDRRVLDAAELDRWFMSLR